MTYSEAADILHTAIGIGLVSVGVEPTRAGGIATRVQCGHLDALSDISDPTCYPIAVTLISDEPARIKALAKRIAECPRWPIGA